MLNYQYCQSHVERKVTHIMSDKKYSVQVSRRIYCSSSGHYFGGVRINWHDRTDFRDLDFNGLVLTWHNEPYEYKGYPKYVRKMIAEQLHELMENNELIVHEYDRDGNARYDNLRYHQKEALGYEISFYYNQLVDSNAPILYKHVDLDDIPF